MAQPRRLTRLIAALTALSCLWLFPQMPAQAVFTRVALGSAPRSITLQVGSATGVDNVVFNVSGAAAAALPRAPVTNPTPGSVNFSITANRVNSGFEPWITLTANSSVALKCVAGTGCGTTEIPFDSISWTTANADPSGLDIQSGAFNGGATQQLTRYQNNYRECTFWIIICLGYAYYDTNMANTLNFQYSNSTLYPAGQYKGRVTFTATML
ncbi:hypothetical protein VCH24_64050 [Variovorax boronicumulans]|nr:hypothetical protein VCH24_64050 [Variovorax boronicumulans]